MTKKTKEVHADALLKLSTSLITALLVAILVVPLSGILMQTSGGVKVFLSSLKGMNGVIFLILEASIFFIAILAKESALKIYNELYPDS